MLRKQLRLNKSRLMLRKLQKSNKRMPKKLQKSNKRMPKKHPKLLRT